jgi:hypothetical protein
MLAGSLTCSSTFEEKQTSTALSATGSRMPSPRTASGGGVPLPASSAGSGSIRMQRAPRARKAAVKWPGPPPMSMTVRPARLT